MASLRNQVKDLKLSPKKRRQDYDPEDEPFVKQVDSDEESESEGSVDETGGREHYETVNKSKLRIPAKTKLDEKKYGGQAVSRNRIFQDDSDADVLAAGSEEEDEDPFAARIDHAEEDEGESEEDVDELVDGTDLDGETGNDEEINSDEAFEDGEEHQFRDKGFVFRGSGKDLKRLPAGSDKEEEDEDEADGGDETELSDEGHSDISMGSANGMEEESADDLSGDDPEDMDEDEDGSESDEDDEMSAQPRPDSMRTTGTTDREKLRALISNDTAALASSLSATLSADAKKGAAVKQQYQTFDRLLDARIKLQKGLTLSNSLAFDDTATNSTTTNEEVETALKKAEEAAIKLYATIESLRRSIMESTTTPTNPDPETQRGQKRKRPSSTPTQSTSTQTLWSRLTALESLTLPTRNTVLDKWSTKTRAATPLPSTSKLATSAAQAHSDSNLSTVLAAYLASESPKLLESSRSTATSVSTSSYDDSHFYQSLLRDLINSRASTNPNGSQSNIPVMPMKLHASGNVGKSRKVDTKASKGRKIRYTVHEKLENFMAGEGRGNAVGQWNDGAVREFFGSLLGQSGLLGEEVEDGGVDEDDEEGREVEALRLFRT